MLETAARLLRLLSLLQSRRDWTGDELASRLGVTTRTIRNDVDRLRGLGYPVDARPGVAGGYRLGAGGSLPPLLLDDDEAVAVAVGLRTAASGSVAGIEEISLRALAKLQQVLPSRLRHRVGAVVAHTLPMPAPGPRVDMDVLTLIAGACRDHERLRFDYRSHSGSGTRRSAEPYRLLNDRRRWYLLAWDVDRDAWRTFRVDRMEPRTPTGTRFTPRELPSENEIVAQVARASARRPGATGHGWWCTRPRRTYGLGCRSRSTSSHWETTGARSSPARTIRRCSRSISECSTPTSRSWIRRSSWTPCASSPTATGAPSTTATEASIRLTPQARRPVRPVPRPRS